MLGSAMLRFYVDIDKVSAGEEGTCPARASGAEGLQPSVGSLPCASGAEVASRRSLSQLSPSKGLSGSLDSPGTAMECDQGKATQPQSTGSHHLGAG